LKFIFLLFITFISSSLTFAYDFDSLSELIKKGKESQAIKRLNQYIQKYPNDPEVKFIYGAALDHFGKTQEAKKVFLQLNTKYPNNSTIHNNLGVLYAKLGEYTSAYTFFESALRLKPNYQEARNNLRFVQQTIN
jgi:Flp pilus assembly protein TadD